MVEEFFRAACPDCPAARENVFSDLVGQNKGECAFHCPAVEPTCSVPQRWFETYGLGLVRRGVLIRQRVDSRGRASAIDAAGPGSAFLLGDEQGTSSSTGYAASRLLVCTLPMTQLKARLAEIPAVAMDLIRVQADALERVERLADARGRSSAIRRVAALLCVLADKLGAPRQPDRVSGLKQRDMASLLCMRHETFCRALTEFEGQGVIQRESGGIAILDRSALEAV